MQYLGVLYLFGELVYLCFYLCVFYNMFVVV